MKAKKQNSGNCEADAKFINEAAVIREPGSSMKNKTGSWRSFRPEPTGKCTGCGMCAWYCPEHCIEVKPKNGRKQAVIDYDYCKGCLICVVECPAKAMTAKAEE